MKYPDKFPAEKFSIELFLWSFIMLVSSSKSDVFIKICISFSYHIIVVCNFEQIVSRFHIRLPYLVLPYFILSYLILSCIILYYHSCSNIEEFFRTTLLLPCSYLQLQLRIIIIINTSESQQIVSEVFIFLFFQFLIR